MTTILSTSLHIFHPFAACLNCTSVVGTPSALLSFSSIGTCLAIVDSSYGVRIGQGQLHVCGAATRFFFAGTNERATTNRPSSSPVSTCAVKMSVIRSRANKLSWIFLAFEALPGIPCHTRPRDSEQLNQMFDHVCSGPSQLLKSEEDLAHKVQEEYMPH